MKQYFSNVKIIILALALGLGLSYAQADWSAPLSAPTTCTSGNPGCDAPINVSATAQIKTGDFTAGGLTLKKVPAQAPSYYSYISPSETTSGSALTSGALFLTSSFAGFRNLAGSNWRWYVLENGNTYQAGTATIAGGSPALGKVLTATNTAGDATWQTPTATGGAIPIGGIIMWSGAVVDIPSGWKLCDGTYGTPNLAGRFIVGVGASVMGSYTPGQIGGTRDSVIVSHRHTFVADDNGLGSVESVAVGVVQPALLNGGGATGGNNLYQAQTSLPRSVNSSGLSITRTGTGNALETGIDKNLPPYYALAFIMRTQ